MLRTQAMSMYRRRTVMATAMTILMPISGCNKIRALASTLDDKSEAWASIQTGISGGHDRATVVQKMGQPLRAETTALAGADAEQLSWADSTNVYTAWLIGGRCVAKKSALKPSEPSINTSRKEQTQ